MSLGKGEAFKELSEPLAMSARGVVKRAFEQALSNGRLGRAIARVVGRPGASASAWPGTPWA